MAIAFIIRRQAQAYRAGKIDTAAMLHHIFFEVLGLLLAMALAILLSQVAVGVAVPLLGSGLVSTVILMIAVVPVVGLGAAWLVKATRGRLTPKCKRIAE
jgi:drug/metabolite transporter (DMT)-like permease